MTLVVSWATGKVSNYLFVSRQSSQSELGAHRLIETRNQSTECLPDVWYQSETNLLEIFFVAIQIAFQQLLLAKDPQHEQQDLG